MLMTTKRICSRGVGLLDIFHIVLQVPHCTVVDEQILVHLYTCQILIEMQSSYVSNFNFTLVSLPIPLAALCSCRANVSISRLLTRVMFRTHQDAMSLATINLRWPCSSCRLSAYSIRFILSADEDGRRQNATCDEATNKWSLFF